MKIPKHTSRTVFLFLSVASFCYFSYVSVNNFISHSEFWSIASADLLGRFTGNAMVVYYKFFFHLILKPLYLFDLSNITHIKSARFIFGLLAFFYTVLFALNVKLISKRWSVASLYLLFLFSIQIYAYNIFRVRADLVAGLFVLVGYTYLNYVFLNNKKLKTYDWKVLAIVWLSFLSTPKAIYLITALFVYQSFLFWHQRSLKNFLMNTVFCYLSPFAVMLAGASFAYSFNWLPENPYILAINYFMESNRNLFNGRTWTNVFLSLEINWFQFLLVIVGFIIFSIKSTLRKERILQAQVLISLCALSAMLLYSEKWAYFLAQLTPWLTLPAVFCFIFINKVYQKIIVVVLMITFPLIQTYPSSWFVTNHFQMQAISHLDSLIKQVDNATYFDSTGLLPRDQGLLHFLGPNDKRSRRLTLQILKDRKPTFIFYTTKVQIAAPEILIFLNQNYLKISEDVWLIKGVSLETHNETNFPLRHLFIYDYRPALR